ncbi:MAG: glycoside hydrolase family 2 [Proteobacteria bacterium]|nr:glycoside hydrolase family 2 [Pseudomonadota bacterium]
MRSACAAVMLLAVVHASAEPELAMPQAPAHEGEIGPYNAVFLQGGVGIVRPLPGDAAVLGAGAPWTLIGWVRPDLLPGARAVIAALGAADPAGCNCLLMEGNRIALRVGPRSALYAARPVEPGSWHAVAATYDGTTAQLYLDGRRTSLTVGTTAAAAPSINLAPTHAADLMGLEHFGGALAEFVVVPRALTAAEIAARTRVAPDFTLIHFQQVGVGWPLQEHAWRGLQTPQDAWTVPRSRAALGVGQPAPLPATAPLELAGPGRWRIGGWRLAAASATQATAAQISSPGFGDAGWYPAVVPGTVLGTLIANGVYPDPDKGLNNLAIPESLARQDYWYRTTFVPPAQARGQQLRLNFEGINYAAEVWLNGTRVGAQRGAFIRGRFDVTHLMLPDVPNVLAVRVSPPPHPGIPHEQSVSAGPGENGGMLALDGPTFIASEGWDWIPGIRDRNTGLWQGVALTASGNLRLGDPNVITRLPLPRTDSADVSISVPVENLSAQPIAAALDARFGEVQVHKAIVLGPGVSEVRLDPSEFRALHMNHPRLWWPNGYGKPELYSLELSVSAGSTVSDVRRLRFGIREITYELSLFDHEGRLRRVEIDPAAAGRGGDPLVDVRHEALKRTVNGWAASLTAAGERSPHVQGVATYSLSPYLVIHVNGVPIAARGGNWGTDDSRKRSARERLEPYFRLHQAAHLNIIRNWLGQSTEEVFYDLADEYGLLVLNDFWESTQDFQLEAEDPQLFLDNAADVIRRFRNHPSIAVWFGRNEGVPQPILNEGLAALVAGLDGTRYYTGSSNRVNLQDSGPYNWRPPEQYFTTLAGGFSVEVGTPSLGSLETLKSYMAPEDLWPLGDVYAYHDWHFGGNGDTASFMQRMQVSLGAATGLEDFERKAQLLNYEAYRAIFEGFQSGLWTRNSGRLLWMTHPAWPSNAWQIYTADYDAAAAYYGVAKACEPLHAQLDLPEFRPTLVNVGLSAAPDLELSVRIMSLDGTTRLLQRHRVSVAANAVVHLAPLDLKSWLDRDAVDLVILSVRDAQGTPRSENVYWEASAPADLGRLSRLAPVALRLTATRHPDPDGATRVEVVLENHDRNPALLARVAVLDANGMRVLPAYYSDNYVTVPGGETRRLAVHCPTAGASCARLSARGWNVVPLTVDIGQEPPRASGADQR